MTKHFPKNIEAFIVILSNSEDVLLRACPKNLSALRSLPPYEEGTGDVESA